MAQLRNKIGDLVAKCNLTGSWQVDAPMSEHTTFRVGGPADVLVFAKNEADLQTLRSLSRNEGLGFTILGRGANLLVADAGIRGIVVSTERMSGCHVGEATLTVLAGTDVSEAAHAGLDAGVSCLEFLNAMPSSMGGAVWMNARCYGSEIADVLLSARVLDEDNCPRTIPFDPTQWSYKVSPFQGRDWIITEATFRTTPAPRQEIERVMLSNAADRTAKGHFRAPCAGSVFKNNHEFGAPSGVIIDRCGLKGLRRGKAVVSEWHANIIVNEGGALARDVRGLIEEVRDRVAVQTGFRLEEEVIYCGDWTSEPR